ncbi:hypothetical protein VCCP1035_3425B, partial [Vibrio cholerae CP1035(8)]
RAND